MKTYQVTAERDGKFWFVQIPGLGATQGRNLSEVPTMARDYIEIVTGESDVDVQVTLVLPAEAKELLAHAAELRAEELRARSLAAVEVRRAAKMLKDRGYTVRDIGAALEISHQRAHQLVAN